MQLISTFSSVETSTFFSVIEMYIKMSEISNFWLSVLISQVAPYRMFILVSKSTHPVSLVLSSENAQCFYTSAPLKDVRFLAEDVQLMIHCCQLCVSTRDLNAINITVLKICLFTLYIW